MHHLWKSPSLANFNAGGQLMNYTQYSEQQLVNLSNKNKLNNKELNKEWRRRYGIKLPVQAPRIGHNY